MNAEPKTLQRMSCCCDGAYDEGCMNCWSEDRLRYEYSQLLQDSKGAYALAIKRAEEQVCTEHSFRESTLKVAARIIAAEIGAQVQRNGSIPMSEFDGKADRAIEMAQCLVLKVRKVDIPWQAYVTRGDFDAQT